MSLTPLTMAQTTVPRKVPGMARFLRRTVRFCGGCARTRWCCRPVPDEPLRAWDVVRALGQQDVRGQVEGMRARLKPRRK